MIIPVKEVVKFIDESAVVRANVLYPGLAETIKIEIANGQVTMTKTNHNIFCVYKFHAPDQPDETIFVNEKSINSIAKTTQSQNIFIYQSGNIIEISGSHREKVKAPVMTIVEYPEIPAQQGEEATISAETVDAIRVAAKYILRDQVINVTSFVHVTPQGIVGTNGQFIAYCNKTVGLPTIYLSDEALQILKSKSEITYSTHGNYDFFKYQHGLLFGVIKSALIKKSLDINFPFAAPGFPAFIAYNEDLLGFCDLVNDNAASALATATLKYNGNILTFIHDDPANHVNVFQEIECETNIEACADFKFSVKWLEVILKSLPYETLTWIRAGNHFYLASKEDEKYRGLLAGIA